MHEIDSSCTKRVSCFLYFPKGNALRETAIPIRKNKNGFRCLEDQDIIQFIKKELARENLNVFSYWTT
jgi:hypothetical protein